MKEPSSITMLADVEIIKVLDTINPSNKEVFLKLYIGDDVYNITEAETLVDDDKRITTTFYTDNGLLIIYTPEFRGDSNV